MCVPQERRVWWERDGERVCLGSATTVMSILTQLAYGTEAAMGSSGCASRALTHTHISARKCALTHFGITFLSLNPCELQVVLNFPNAGKSARPKRTHIFGIVRWNPHYTVADIIKWSHVCYTSAIESLSCAFHTAPHCRRSTLSSMPLVWYALRMRHIQKAKTMRTISI